MGFYDRLENISINIDCWWFGLRCRYSFPYSYLRFWPSTKSRRIMFIGREMEEYSYVLSSDQYEYPEHLNGIMNECGKAAYNKAIDLFNNEKYWWMSKIK